MQSQFTLQQLVAQQRIDAGETVIFTAFPDWAKQWERDGHIEWPRSGMLGLPANSPTPA